MADNIKNMLSLVNMQYQKDRSTIAKKPDNPEDFEIGNAKYAEISRRQIISGIEKNIGDNISVSEKELLLHYFSNKYDDEESAGIGYDDKWSVRIHRIIEKFDKVIGDVNILKPEARQKIDLLKQKRDAVIAKRTWGQPYMRDAIEHDDLLREIHYLIGIKDDTEKTFTRYLNTAVVEEVSHSLGYEHTKDEEDQENKNRFFYDLVELRTDPRITIDVD